MILPEVHWYDDSGVCVWCSQ